MRFGISPCTQSPPAGEHLDRLVDQIIEQAQQAERYGFDSFLLTEHHQQLCHRLLGRPASESGPFCQALGARGGQGVGRVASHGLDVDFCEAAGRVKSSCPSMSRSPGSLLSCGLRPREVPSAFCSRSSRARA